MAQEFWRRSGHSDCRRYRFLRTVECRHLERLIAVSLRCIWIGVLLAVTAPTNATPPAENAAVPRCDAEIEPPLPPLQISVYDHAPVCGWSSDATEFGYCVEKPSNETVFEFVDAAGNIKRLAYPYDEAGMTSFEESVETRGFSRAVGRWRNGKELVLTWETSPDLPPKLRVGAKLRDAHSMAYPIQTEVL